ncbi:ABC transporter substrate-binding protein [Stackebrandtia nassauensis]|uniref:Extracellular solute-binding protein family 1 n=1 Tax=Stackebrandtia nassauensis (strain DSM 44728 / CIP 108903 / NRRL B-16338 / NBRC 102104 / LLR-40K-21) TaxID=446470 RepID=D3Q1P5_STANL|nr:extracellular solute-binding protein [Stackebrandtia nassauensis]ADD39893.1 extracellular solute-binding protein family 1 [Stackebrandtia nassauensis DSM 44728]
MATSPHRPPAGLSRRSLLGGAAALAAVPLLSSCVGFNTSGGKAGSLDFLSTQFTPVEEKQRFEKVLADAKVNAAYNAVEGNVFASTLTSQAEAGSVQVSLAGAMHGELAPLADRFTDVDGLLKGKLAQAEYPKDLLELAKAGGSTAKYIPWMQASYVVAVHKRALEWLPSGADVNSLTYDQYLDWAIAARKANGSPVFGFPAGPDGLYARFVQGHLLPSFTGGQVTTFRSADAIDAWKYMKELWANFVPASTNYDNMQEPLAKGEVMVAWDHIARIIEAPKGNPDEWLLVPSPKGPKGLGYMLVVAGLAIPDGAPDPDGATDAILSLSEPDVQIEVLKQNTFFPVSVTELPDDLEGATKLAAEAITAQREAKDAIMALPPVGTGERDGEVTAVFQNSFRQICLDDRSIKSVVDEQAAELQSILDDLKIPCWAPDPAEAVCEVG